MQTRRKQLATIRAWRQRLLPRVLPEMPGWRIAGHHAPGSGSGGDYYDFIRLGDGRWMIVVGDAGSADGPGAALVALVRTLLHSCPLSCGQERLPFCPINGSIIQPAHVVLANLNRALVENTLETQSMTAFCGVLSPLEGNLNYANAGHVAPRWYRAGRQKVEPLGDTLGLPLGMGHNSVYRQKRIEISSGDTLLFFTEGLTTLVGESGSVFGMQRLDEAIREWAPRGPDALKTGLLALLDQHLGQAKLSDDYTLIIFQRE